MAGAGFLTCMCLVLTGCFCCCATLPQPGRQPWNDRPVIGKWTINSNQKTAWNHRTVFTCTPPAQVSWLRWSLMKPWNRLGRPTYLQPMSNTSSLEGAEWCQSGDLVGPLDNVSLRRKYWVFPCDLQQESTIYRRLLGVITAVSVDWSHIVLVVGLNICWEFPCDRTHRLTLTTAEYENIFRQINGWAVNVKTDPWLVPFPRGPHSSRPLSVQPVSHRRSCRFAEVRFRQGGQAFLQPGAEGLCTSTFLSQIPVPRH